MADAMTAEERRDAAKIAARRAREADRVKRMIHDPFNRQVGVPLQDIKQQIKENEERRRLAANQAQEEMEQQRRLAALMEARELERRQEDQQKKAQLQASWEAARQMKADQRERERRQERDATSRSLMSFAGEDPLKGERSKMQQIQMKRWIMQQQELKRQQNEKNHVADEKYLRGLEALNNLANREEEKKQAEAKRIAMEVRNENLMAARFRREQSSRERKRALQGAGRGLVTGSDEGRTGAGAEFRGLTHEQRRQIQEENARLVLEAQARKEREKQEQREYSAMLRAQATYAERSAIEAAEARKQRQLELKAALEQQKFDAEVQRRAEDRRNKKNASGFADGFFDGFGKTSR